MVNNQAEKNSAVLHFAFRTADVGYLIREIAICLNIWQGQSRRCPTSTNIKANRTLNTIGFRPSLRPNPSSIRTLSKDVGHLFREIVTC